MTNKLHELLTLLHIACEDHRIIQGISNDSRIVQKDWIFVSEHQSKTKQLQYIQEALQKQAVVLCDICLQEENVYCCENIQHIQQVLLELYYGYRYQDMTVIGVTGTNGKTSVAGMITQLLRLHDYKVLRIGTHEVDMDCEKQTIRNTTPDVYTIVNLLEEAYKKKIRYIVMEVSSHAIDQNRIALLRYDYLIYTTIQQDHLDYHLTKTHYRFTKYKLRKYLKSNGKILLYKDADFYHEFTALLTDGMYVAIDYEKPIQYIKEDIEFDIHQSKFTLFGVCFKTSLLGQWNIDNLVQAIVCVHLLGVCIEDLQNDVKKLQPEKGRMEVLYTEDRYIWIDYAHTPSALQQILRFANIVKKNRVICLFGCGGNRDRKKRAMMTQIACDESDIVVLTTDNPRDESIQQIFDDMMIGVSGSYKMIENRGEAIKHCLNIAKKNDIIVIAGKGDEHTQEIQGVYYPFHDKTYIWDLLHEEEISWK